MNKVDSSHARSGDASPPHSSIECGGKPTFLPKNGQGKRWHVFSSAAALEFADDPPEYPRAIVQLLRNRGIQTEEQIREFFHSDYLTHVHDPYLFLDMEKAVGRIVRALDSKEKIVIFGDYDADGVCGSVVLSTALMALGADVELRIPHRFKDGYGLNIKAASEIAADKKVGVVATIDCGTSDREAVALLNTKGKDVIIIDHHLVPEEAPDCFAMLNPKREGETYPFKYLCATGVAFKLASALLKTARADTAGVKEGVEKWLLDVVAIGSVADMVPLLGENRTLVKYGLIVINNTRREGLKEILRFQPPPRGESQGDVTSETIAFMIAPRINATSRMAHAAMSFDLLMTEDKHVARELAEKIEELNTERRKAVDKIMKEAKEMVTESDPVLFVGKEEWPVGVVGLIAGRLTEKYGKPTFVYGGGNGHYRGSCRGVDGFHVVEAMRFCDKKEQGILLALGGHPMAGGFSVEHEKLERFREYVMEFGHRTIGERALHPLLLVDAELEPEDITWDLLDVLLKLEPHGEGNKKPLFLLRGAQVVSLRAVGQKEDHLKMKLKAECKDGAIRFFDCIGFGLFLRREHFNEGDTVDAVFELEANVWNGAKEIQFKLKDIRKAGE